MAKKISKKDLHKKLKGLTVKIERRKAVNEDLQKSINRLEERLDDAERRLDEVERAQEHARTKDADQSKQPTTSAGKTQESSGAATKAPTSSPDESWTVKELRDEARKREVPSYSTKNKAELLSALG